MKKFISAIQITDMNGRISYAKVMVNAKVESDAEIKINKQYGKEGYSVRFLETRPV